MVMLLTILITGMCYMVLGYIQKKIGVFTTKIDTTLHISTAEYHIEKDFNRFSTLYWNPSNQTLILKNPIDSVHYEFRDEKLFRNKVLLLDKIQQKEFLFRGIPSYSGVIDAFFLEIEDPSKLPLKLIFVQPKSAALYVPKSL